MTSPDMLRGIAEEYLERTKGVGGHERLASLIGLLQSVHAQGRREGAEWQPIETAPKMRCILLFAFVNHPPGNYKMGSGHWSTGHDAWIWEGREIKPYEIAPTHWMPLPEPLPATPEDAREDSTAEEKSDEH